MSSATMQQTRLILAGPASHFLKAGVLHELEELATRLGERLGCAASAAWYAGGKPTLMDALAAAARAGATRIVVVPHLLQWRYPDQSFLPAQVQEFAAAHPEITLHLARPVGLTPAVEATLAEHARAALDGPALGELDAAALRDLAQHAPSIKHRPTAPRYPGFQTHVFLCQAGPCVDMGALPIERALRAAVQEAGRDKGPERIHITRTQCLGPCPGGPIVAVYPTGDWYYGITADRIPDLVSTIVQGSDAAADRRFHPQS